MDTVLSPIGIRASVRKDASLESPLLLLLVRSHHISFPMVVRSREYHRSAHHRAQRITRHFCICAACIRTVSSRTASALHKNKCSETETTPAFGRRDRERRTVPGVL